MTTAHYINGRVFCRSGGGGVYRYASEVAARLSAAKIIRPRSASHPWSARVWEQTTLHRATVDGVLLSMAHGGPLRHRRHIVVIYDLLAITMPASVHPAFAAIQRAQLPALIRRAAMVAPISAHVADEVGATFNVAPERLCVVPPGISDIFRPGARIQAKRDLGVDPARPVISALLDPARRKNSGAVTQVLEDVVSERPDVQLVVAGDTSPATFARTRTSPGSSRPVDAVDLRTASDSQLAALYRAADVFVALSSAEGFGLPVVEAARCGAAVVTTPVPSVFEHCPDGVVVVDDATGAKSAVLTLLDSPEQRRELAARAQAQLGDLDWASTASVLDDLMASVEAI